MAQIRNPGNVPMVQMSTIAYLLPARDIVARLLKMPAPNLHYYRSLADGGRQEMVVASSDDQSDDHVWIALSASTDSLLYDMAYALRLLWQEKAGEGVDRRDAREFAEGVLNWAQGNAKPVRR